MRVAFVSDVHGNLPALRSALEFAERQGAERVVTAGDLVGDGPHPVEVVRELRGRGVAAIRGNVDRKVLELGDDRAKLEKKLDKKGKQRQNRAWTALQLVDAPEERQWLAELPEQRWLEQEGSRVLVVHGSPRSDTDYLFPSLTPEALQRKLEPVDGPAPAVLVCGHSHVPFAREVAGIWVINCGSVGRPADGDPRGSLGLVEFGARGIARAGIARFPYPVEEVAAAVEERGVPGIDPEEYRLGIKP